MSSAAPQKILLPKFAIKIEAGPHAGESYYPDRAAVNIGRGPENEVVLSNDPKISRQHVRITYSRGLFQIENISGKNSLLVDDVQVQSGPLRNGATIIAGESEILFEYEDIPRPQAQSTNPKKNPNSPVPSPNMGGNFNSKNPPSLAPHPMARVGGNNARTNVGPYNPNSQFPGGVARPQNGRANPGYGGTNSQTSKLPMILIVIIALVGVFFFSKNEEKKARLNQLKLKSKDQVEKELESSRTKVQDYLKAKKINTDGELDTTARSAETYFVKGFRDYRQGQYSRAIQSFQACLSFDPDHVLAKKYLMTAYRKLDEKNQLLMLQGKRYRSTNNYRLCKASFQQVMISRGNTNDALYKEAKTYFDECDYLMRGRF